MDRAEPPEPPSNGPDGLQAGAGPPEMSWRGWGDPARAAPLPAAVVALLRELLGVRPADRPLPSAPPEPPEPRLAAGVLAALRATVRDPGEGGRVRTDAASRIGHTRGKSTPDLLRIRAGDAGEAPDAVVLPGSHDEVLAVLELCAGRGVAVVPFGGGTSVVGGLTPRRADFSGVVALDLRRLDSPADVDAESRTATLGAGLRAPRAEALLRAHGLTLGHFPQSYEWATIGGFAATRSSGQASAGHGRFDDMVVALTAATPEGTLRLGRAPKSAAGPDLRQLVLGSEGAFGVITSVTVGVGPAPRTSAYEGWRFGGFAAGTAALRALAQDGPLPTVLRLSDETETMVGLAGPESIGGPVSGAGCLLIAGFEGEEGEVADRRSRAAAVLRDAGGEPLGDAPGESWRRGRFAAPYLRDALLDVGAFAETLETAAFWSGLPALYEAVREALVTTLAARDTPPLVMCHISHVYPAGASLYFTVVCAQGADPLDGWARAKDAVGRAIIASGGTISHHHGVGTDHLDWYAREIGPLALDVLRAVKHRLDPEGILNPGVLIPSSPPSPPEPPRTTDPSQEW